MIHVNQAPEPKDFNRKVRQPGLRAIAELVGERPLPKRRGRPRAKIAERREDIPAAAFPDFWTRAIDDMLVAYGRICAYMCVFIEPVTGIPTVDHMLPKSMVWELVYEWANYSLACSLVNTWKGDVLYVLDPFHVETGWFELELVGFQLKANDKLQPNISALVNRTITRLRLNDKQCRDLREYYSAEYWTGRITHEHLQSRAPFIAMELRRQGRLREIDT